MPCFQQDRVYNIFLFCDEIAKGCDVIVKTTSKTPQNGVN